MPASMGILKREQIKQLLRKGYRHIDIAQLVGVHRVTVWRIARCEGIKNHKAGRPFGGERRLKAK